MFSLRRAIALDRTDAGYPLQLATILMGQGVDATRMHDAEGLLLQAMRLDPHNRPEVYRALAALYLQQGRLDLADRIYKEGLAVYRGHDLGRGSVIYTRLWPDVIELYLDAAELAVRRGDRAGAVAILRELLTEDPYAVPGAV